MKPAIIRAVLAPNTPPTRATIQVAIGLLGTLAADVAKDLAEAQRALGQRRRQHHDEILAEAVVQAESIAYITRWITTRTRASHGEDDFPLVITGLDDPESEGPPDTATSRTGNSQ